MIKLTQSSQAFFDPSQLSPTLMNEAHLESIFGGMGLKRAAINNYDDMGQCPGKKSRGKEKASESSGEVVVPQATQRCIIKLSINIRKGKAKRCNLFF